MSDGSKSLINLGSMAIVILVVAAIVLIAIAIVGGYSKVLRTNTLDAIDGFNVTLVNNTKLVGTSGQYPFLQDLTNCINASIGSQNLSTSFYSITEGSTAGGKFTLLQDGAAWNDTLVNCTIGYLADSDSQAAADTFSVGLAIFGAFAGVLVLGVIGLAIISLFRKRE